MLRYRCNMKDWSLLNYGHAQLRTIQNINNNNFNNSKCYPEQEEHFESNICRRVSRERLTHRVSAVFTPSERLILARESSCCLLIPVSYIPHIISPPATESLGDSAGAWSGQWADARLPRSAQTHWGPASQRKPLTDWLFTCTCPSLLSTRGKLIQLF